MTQTITATVNGASRTSEVEPRMLLVHWIREVLGLKGAHVEVEESQINAIGVAKEGRQLDPDEMKTLLLAEKLM